MIRILIVDDQAVIRHGLRSILSDEPDLEVIGEAGDGLTAVSMAAALRPDLVLMDLRMPRLDGIEATRRIRSAEVAPAVLVLTTFDLDEHVLAAFRAGAVGFVLKDTGAESLVSAVREVAAGNGALAPTATLRLIQYFAALPPPGEGRRPAAGMDSLTPREREVLQQVARALSNSEIAEALSLSEATVKTHISRVLSKLGMRDRTQLVVAAYEGGLVVPGE
jgi:DNA-binding NarL/FixJ family response regulator